MNPTSLTRGQVNSARFGRYSTLSGEYLGWRVNADNTGPAGSLWSVGVTFGRCGTSYENIGHVKPGRGVSDRIAALVTARVPELVHVPESCTICGGKDAPYVIQWQPSEDPRERSSRGRWFVKDVATGVRLVESLDDKQAAARWLRDYLAAAVQRGPRIAHGVHPGIMEA